MYSSSASFSASTSFLFSGTFSSVDSATVRFMVESLRTMERLPVVPSFSMFGSIFSMPPAVSFRSDVSTFTVTPFTILPTTLSSSPIPPICSHRSPLRLLVYETRSMIGVPTSQYCAYL